MDQAKFQLLARMKDEDIKKLISPEEWAASWRDIHLQKLSNHIVELTQRVYSLEAKVKWTER